MEPAYYIPRRLKNGDKQYTEDSLLAASNHIVILAEPGGGKTALLESLAHKLGGAAVTANVFRYTGATANECPLLIDAFDELAKIDQTGIHVLLANAKKANPTYVIISSRSSEWGNAATGAFKAFLGIEPLVARLFEFEEPEQRVIFEQHVPGENFSQFCSEVSRFDLAPLLPNPQFLKLFADAYVESDRHFPNKRSIFSQAVERLAKEVNKNTARTGPLLSTVQKVDISSEVFAKLLLSGAEGISTTEVSENRAYPLLDALFIEDKPIEGILATRLFRPGDSADHHRSIHKIVAEYCAADYLTKRIADPADSLSLAKCLAIIAPSSTVRDELRGVLGWMASLGNQRIQFAAIERDPYAVLSNGDPSQLDHSSKRLLIRKLKAVEAEDPYFRKGDFWRSFSAAGFFTPDVIEEIKPLLSAQNEGQLRDLILELLAGSPALVQLEPDLRRLALASNESENTRLLAVTCLLDIVGYDHSMNLAALISLADQTSLKVAATIIETLKPDHFEKSVLASFLRACSNLYPNENNARERTIGKRFFIKRSIRRLDLAAVEWLLDELTGDLTCTCGKDVYECHCRVGISKVVGSMLDRYFELASPPYNSLRIWAWCANLKFQEQKGPNESKAVEVLRTNDSLRQQIMAHIFAPMTNRDLIYTTRIRQFSWYGHAGLHFTKVDLQFIVDLAFEHENCSLWASFFAEHHYYQRRKDPGPDPLRRHMREQALQKPTFMYEWAKANKAAAERALVHRMPNSSRIRRARRHAKDETIRAANIKYMLENRSVIEDGRHWGALSQFARLVLMQPEKIEHWVGDELLVRNALANCIDFITPTVPNLGRLAELQCASQASGSEMILCASCLEIMRIRGNLEGLDLGLLRALRTNIHIHYNAVTDESRAALKAEIDRLVFPDAASTEYFIRQYLEPQVARPGCVNAEVWLLRDDEVFSHLRATLPIEWMSRFLMPALHPLDVLFEMAAQYGNRTELKRLIAERCAQYMCDWPVLDTSNNIEQHRIFWLVRAWYFLDDIPESYWNWLKADKETLLLLQERSGRISYNDHPAWPKLRPSKIEAILDAFIEKWPKVYLPDHWGTGSPKEEEAYRFLKEIIWLVNSGEPDEAIPVLNRLLADSRFEDMYKDLKSIRAGQIRKQSLRDFEAPTPLDIVSQLDRDQIVTVEGLRLLLLQELEDFQRAIAGGEFDSADRFYEKGERLGEVRSTQIIAERLSLRLEPQGITITPEHQLRNANRSDFTASKIIQGRRRLLVTEVKGQWHKELYTAATAQLFERYSIHPDAEQQGIFLVIWFGPDEEVARRKSHGLQSAQALKISIEKLLPPEVKGLIDVFVLDVSKSY